jgi:integrase
VAGPRPGVRPARRPGGRPTPGLGEWKELLAAAGVRDVRVHDGRHTAGTLLIAQGIHIRAVQEILGHSDVRTTEGYTHVGSDVARGAAVRMGRALWGSDDD